MSGNTGEEIRRKLVAAINERVGSHDPSLDDIPFEALVWAAAQAGFTADELSETFVAPWLASGAKHTRTLVLTSSSRTTRSQQTRRR